MQQSDGSQPTTAAEREIETLLNELAELSRNINQSLDERAAELRRLITAADERIAMLQDLQSQDPSPEPHPLTAAIQPAAEREPTLRANQHAEVWALADQGLTPGEIAHNLSRPKGEIELILALRERA